MTLAKFLHMIHSFVDNSRKFGTDVPKDSLTPSFPNEPSSTCNGRGNFLRVMTISQPVTRGESIRELDESINLYTKVRPDPLSFRAITK